MRAPLLALLAAAAPLPALAAPQVVADIAPVHSLVAAVMAGAGEPVLAVPPGTSPHDAALRPSEARHLAEADLVVWTGPALLPWMGEALATLAPDAAQVALLELPGWEVLPARDLPGGGHDHDHGHDHGHEGEEHAHEEDHGEDHGEDHAGEEHEHADHAEEAAHEEHAHGPDDPHAWLDPAVAATWLPAIAEALAAADPENAALYRDNAAREAGELRALAAALPGRLAPLQGRGFALPHDSLQYFERAAGLRAAAAVSPVDGGAPATSAMVELREGAQAGVISCVLTEPGTPADWAPTLIEGTAARTARIDPEGIALPPGPDLYPTLIEDLAAALESCLG